jgi:hypothetical protein
MDVCIPVRRGKPPAITKSQASKVCSKRGRNDEDHAFTFADPGKLVSRRPVTSGSFG